VYIHDGYRLINKVINSHITENSTNFSTLGSILKDFWEPMSVGTKAVLLVEDDMTLYTPCRVRNSWGSNVYVHDNHAHQRKDGLSHYQNSTSLSAFSSISKDFWEPMSVNVRVILLVEHDKTLYIPV
jgi:hypothetical protein